MDWISTVSCFCLVVCLWHQAWLTYDPTEWEITFVKGGDIYGSCFKL